MFSELILCRLLLILPAGYLETLTSLQYQSCLSQCACYYMTQCQRPADFFLDLMYLQVPQETTPQQNVLKLTRADGKNVREFLQKRLDSSTSKAIFDQVHLFMVNHQLLYYANPFSVHAHNFGYCTIGNTY